MKSNEWTKARIEEVMALRAEQRELFTRIQELTAARDNLSGKEKGALTRQITPLQAQSDAIKEVLKQDGTPPNPMNPKDAYARLRKSIARKAQGEEDDLRRSLSKIVAAGASDPDESEPDRLMRFSAEVRNRMEWEAGEWTKAAAVIGWCGFLLAAETLEDLVSRMDKLQAKLTREQMGYTPSSSSGTSHRLADRALCEARVRFIEQIGEWWGVQSDWLAERVEAWRILNES